jgi:mannitol-1-phosphate 5-dehydrogenase
VTRTPKRFFGFGFGPIQIGLMALEAHESGNFDRIHISEIDDSLVRAVRENRGTVRVNVAGKTGIRTLEIPGIRIFNPSGVEGREAILEAIGNADEMATALPSVAAYRSGGESSPAALIAQGVTADKPRILYASENDNRAAEILEAAVLENTDGAHLSRFQILNTVIGKMSGWISSARQAHGLGLEPLVPDYPRWVLVEEWNRILISRVRLPGFRRGIPAFAEKDDLLPFEEAKLFGHNAVHALLGCLARLSGYALMSEIRSDPALFRLGRTAFLEESGRALVLKHGATGDALFTAEGFRAYAEDLLERMTNPFLADAVDRIVRDLERKLGYADRLVGAMREALRFGIEPRTLSLGAAAAASIAAGTREPDRIRPYLDRLWGSVPDDGLRDSCAALVVQALPRLEEFRPKG